MQVLPYSEDGYRLLQEGAIALAEVESRGMAVDVPYIERAIKETKERVRQIEQKLEDTEVMQAWRKRFRSKVNIDSKDQLRVVLFDYMGFKQPKKKTEGGDVSADEETLFEIKDPGVAAFVQQYLLAAKLKKAASTNLRGILREAIDGRVHPFFNLHTVVTYRSSSDRINFQNQPIRDPQIGELVRRAFVASEGNHIVELDFSGAEVRVGASYHQDPKMIDYILNPANDMHRDTAADLFFFKPGDVPKVVRQDVKSNFVFAEFYGAWYLMCAERLWKFANDPRALTNTGTPLVEHLRDNGITGPGAMDPDENPVPGTFEYHVQQVEKVFWKDRFRVYDGWKREWFDAYRRQGFFLTKTGFICQGFMGRKEVCNYPIQGSSFHILLRALVWLVRQGLKARKMKSFIAGQIHDSIVADVVPSELDEFLHLCRKAMVKLAARWFPWLVVPMEIEASVAPVGGSWADKEDYEISV